MKKKILLIFILVFSQIFSNIKDSLNIFTEIEVKEIEEKIAIFEKKNKINILIETSKYQEGLIVEFPVRTIVIRMNWILENNDEIIRDNSIRNELDQKPSKKMKSISVQQKFTQDLEMDEFNKELNDIMDGTEKYLEKQEFKKYIIESINGLENLMKEIHKEENKKIYSIPEIMIMLLLILLFFLTFFNIMVKLKKKYKNRY